MDDQIEEDALVRVFSRAVDEGLFDVGPLFDAYSGRGSPPHPPPQLSLGFTGDDLEMRSMLFVCYHAWESPMFREISRKRRREQIAKRIELLMSKLFK